MRCLRWSNGADAARRECSAGTEASRRLPRSFRGSDGTAVIEMALVFPVLMGIVAVCLQFALVFLTYVSLMFAGRDLARWLVIHPDTTDSSAIAALEARLPEDIYSNKLTVTISPACSSLNSAGRCASRTVGTQLQLTLNYDATSLYFLPRPAGFSPSALTYTTYFMVEVF